MDMNVRQNSIHSGGNRAGRRLDTTHLHTDTHKYSSYRNSFSIYPQELAKSFWGRGRGGENVPRKCPWPPHPHAPFKTSCKEAQRAQGCPAFGDLGPGLGRTCEGGKSLGEWFWEQEWGKCVNVSPRIFSSSTLSHKEAQSPPQSPKPVFPALSDSLVPQIVQLANEV